MNDIDKEIREALRKGMKTDAIRMIRNLLASSIDPKEKARYTDLLSFLIEEGHKK